MVGTGDLRRHADRWAWRHRRATPLLLAPFVQNFARLPILAGPRRLHRAFRRDRCGGPFTIDCITAIRIARMTHTRRSYPAFGMAMLAGSFVRFDESGPDRGQRPHPLSGTGLARPLLDAPRTLASSDRLRNPGVNGLIYGYCLSVVFVFQVTFAVNSIGHLWGPQRDATGEGSRNNMLLGYLAMGDGWHNNHHRAPSSAPPRLCLVRTRHCLPVHQVFESRWTGVGREATADVNHENSERESPATSSAGCQSSATITTARQPPFSV